MKTSHSLLVVALVVLTIGSVERRVLAQSPPAEPEHPTTTQAPSQSPSAEAPPEPEGRRIGDFIVTGSIEIGYRFRTIDGSVDSYRSQVDLQQGPTLAFSRVELRSPNNDGFLFDDLVVEGSGLFGEPETYGRVRASKRGIYVVDWSDRTIDTFNYVPDFANPLFEDGVILAPHGWDRRRRIQHVNAKFFPMHRVEGFFSFDRSAQSGLAYGTEIASDSLIFDRDLKNRSNEFNGGVTLRWPTWTLTLEQGARFYRDDELDVADPTVVTDPELLASFRRNRVTEVTAPTSRAVFTASPFEDFKVTARTLYTDYHVTGTLDETLDSIGSDPLGVRTSGGADGHGFLFDSTQSYRLFDRLTLSNWVTYRRTRTAGSADVFFTVNTPDVVGEEDRFLTGYRNAWLSDGPLAEYDVTRDLTLRAGYTFARRESLFASDKRIFDIATGAPGAVDASNETDDQRLDVFSVGGTYRLRHDARVYVNYENGRAPSSFFGAADGQVFFERPGDYEKIEARGMVRPAAWIELLGTVNTYERSYHSQPLFESIEPPLQQTRSRGASATVRVTPDPRYSLGVTYNRLFSTASITYLQAVDQLDGTFADETRFTRYENRENDVSADFTMYPLPKVTIAGFYTLSQAGGSFPLHYHTGQLRGLYEIRRGVSGVLEWRLYDYDDHRFGITDYRANLTTVGVRWEW